MDESSEPEIAVKQREWGRKWEIGQRIISGKEYKLAQGKWRNSNYYQKQIQHQ